MLNLLFPCIFIHDPVWVGNIGDRINLFINTVEIQEKCKLAYSVSWQDKCIASRNYIEVLNYLIKVIEQEH